MTVGLVGLAGCGSGELSGAPSATTARPSTSPGGAKGRTTTAGGSPSTTAPPPTSTLGALPPVLRSSPSAVDSAAIRSAADLARAFQCSAQVAPIEIPATGAAPAVTVCLSQLAGGESIYLWFVDSPDSRYLALKAALARGAAVRGGTTWVAAGARASALAPLGGDVYK